MITSSLIITAYYALLLVIGVFPLSTGFPQEVQTAFAFLGGYVGMLDPLIPIDTLGTVVALLITLELIIFSFNVIQWAYSKVPFLGK